MPASRLLAGYPDRFPLVYHRLRLALGDMTILLEHDGQAYAIVRNIEMDRTSQSGRFATVYCPEDLVPADKIDGNRNIAFAQAGAALCAKLGLTDVVSDQMLPLVVADVLRESGVSVVCDRELGILERRRKDDWEVDQLRAAQSHTENAIRHAFEVVRDAEDRDGVLVVENAPLTSERLRSMIAMHLLSHGLASPDDCIAAGGPIGSDCHHSGAGPLRVNEPLILDVFPLHLESRYFGDCTRTLVRGEIDPRLAEMHAAVVEAKAAATRTCRAGVTAADVHAAAKQVFLDRGYHIGMPDEGMPDDTIFYPHGTGHGIGLEVHEPPLLDDHGGELVVGDALTIEPALYCRTIGGVRIEDMVITRENGCENLNTLPESLWWE